MKELIRRITRRGAQRPPEETAVPQDRREEGLPANPQITEPAAPALKPPPELPLFFMLSHLEDDGPVRLDGGEDRGLRGDGH